jgi:hypothetical protein
MQAIVSQRLAEGAGALFYPASEINAGLNEAQRVFVMLTLCIEKTAPWTIPADTTFTHMLTVFPDWIAPLRLVDADGAKIRPSRLSDLWALDSQWPGAKGAPERYAAMGSDLLALYRTPQGPTPVTVQYAGAPATMSAPIDVPGIPLQFHELLVKYAIPRTRMVEGGAEFTKTLPLDAEFMAAASDYAAYVRARNIAAGYDTLPPEIAGLDFSHAKKGK